MGLLSKLGNFLARLERRDSFTQALLADGQEVRWSDKNLTTYAKEAFLNCVIAYRCILEIAQGVSSVPLYLMSRRGRTGKEVEIEEHPILDLMYQPNPDDSFSFLVYQYIAFLGLAGDGYMERVWLATEARKSGDFPRELYVLRPDRMTVLQNNDTGALKGYSYKVGTKERQFLVDPLTGKADILHTKLFHPLDDWYGSPPAQTAARNIDTDNEGVTWNKRLLQNQARPGMLYIFKQMLSDSQYNRLKKEIREHYSSGIAAGQSMILEGEGADAKPYGFSPLEMDFIEGGREQARRIALAYGVPPQLLGIPGDSTFANYEQASLAFAEKTISFYLNLFVSKFNTWMFERGSGLFLKPDMDALPALEPRRKEHWDKAVNATFLSIGERRAIVGYDALKNEEQNNAILIPSGMSTLEQVLEPPEPIPTGGGFGPDGSLPEEEEEE